MTSYKKLNTKIYEKTGPELTPDSIHWKKFTAPVLIKEFGPIDHIDFSPIEPYYFAVTCSVRVQIYNPITKLVVKNLSRFRENAYGAVFKSDGRLLCAGGEEKNVKLFDVSTKNLLRLFKGHEAAVHRVIFMDKDPQIASFSDDKTVRLWDIPTEQTLIKFNEHKDYIRAGATSPMVPNMILSGGYDNIVNMYDTRTSNVVFSVDHKSPVESLLYLPTGGIFLSAGGTDIKIWDTISGGKLIGSISQHHKTITCLRLTSDNKKLLSGSLDRHVKIYDITNFKVVHTINYHNSVLSLGISKDDGTLVAGLVDGLVAVSRREVEKKIEKKISYKYMSNIHQSDNIVLDYKPEKQSKYDLYLRKFQYSKALDEVLKEYASHKKPHITVSVVQELIRRRAFEKAISNRNDKSLIKIVRFFIRNITDYRFTRVLIDAVNIFLNVYDNDIKILSPELNKQILHLTRLLNEETELNENMTKLQGAMQMLLAGCAATFNQQKSINENNIPHNLIPSVDAQKNLIVNLI